VIAGEGIATGAPIDDDGGDLIELVRRARTTASPRT
jgi:hypothetical protein